MTDAMAINVNPFAPYFGPPKRPIDDGTLGLRPALTLPDAYLGQNFYLQQVFQHLLTTDDLFMTNETDGVLPLTENSALTVEWSQLYFNRPLLGAVPEMGVSRLIETASSRRSETQQRYGLAMMLEHGFMNTERGQEAYRETLASLSEFGGACKNQHGLELAVSRRRTHMIDNGVRPDTLLVPRGALPYLFMVKPEYSSAQNALGGATAGLERFTEAMTAEGRTTTYMGLTVHETKAFELGDGEFYDPLERTAQFGEYYVFPADNSIDSIQIFNAELDQYETITRADVVKADLGRQYASDLSMPIGAREVTEVKDAPSDLMDAHKRWMMDNTSGHGFTKTEIDFAAGALASVEKVFRTYFESKDSAESEPVRHAKAKAEIERAKHRLFNTEGSDPVLTRLNTLYLMAEVAKNDAADSTKVSDFSSLAEFIQSYKSAAIDKDTTAFNQSTKSAYLLFRPFITTRMASAILCKRGKELGITALGHVDFQLADDVMRKVHLGNLTLYSKSVVFDGQRVSIIPDQFFRHYVGGMDSTFLTTETLKQMRDNNLFHAPLGSLIAVPLDDAAGPPPLGISITGVYPKAHPFGAAAERWMDRNSDSFTNIRQALNIDMSERTFMYSESPDGFDVPVCNIMCYPGRVLAKDGSVLQTGSGHLANRAGPGLRDVLAGLNKYLPNPESKSANLML